MFPSQSVLKERETTLPFDYFLNSLLEMFCVVINSLHLLQNHGQHFLFIVMVLLDLRKCYNQTSQRENSYEIIVASELNRP